MQTFAYLIAVLASATVAAAEPPAPASAGAPPSSPQFNASDEVPELPGYEDVAALYELKVGGLPMTEAEQTARWQDELKAGRARAGTLVGSQLSYLALTSTDCDAARDALTRADALGSDQAAWQLAQLAENKSCGDVDVAVLERWLKKAVTLDYLVAARQLIEFNSSTGLRPDPAQQYLYARVAGAYWEAVNKDGVNAGRTEFDATSLQEMEKTLPAADRKRAEAEAAQIVTQMLKRHERFIPTHPQEFARGGQAAKASRGWGYVGQTIDYHHECAWNLTNNCRGAQRLAFVDLSNNEADFMDCKVDLSAKDFVTGTARSLTRQVLLGPKTTRRLILGDVTTLPDKGAMVANCKAVPKLIESAAAGRCRAKLQNSIDADQFYPAAARNAAIEGDAVVRFWVPAGTDEPVDAEIARSSGYPALDAAAIDTIRSGKFGKDCDYALGTIKIAFKLKE